MAVTCSATGVVTNAACYTRATLNPNQQKALLVLAKVFLLANVGGTNYSQVTDTTLVTDASQMVCGITPDGLEAGNIAIWMEAAGLTATSLTAKLVSTNEIINLDLQTLEKMNVFLNCKILSQLGY